MFGLEFQLAPFIIGFLLVICGYLLTRWVDNLFQLKQWKRLAHEIDAAAAEQVEAMRSEGCAALGALQNIFNGITAQGMPHSKTMCRVADEAAAVILEAPSCDHKAQAEHATMRAESWEKIADRLADEQIQTKQDIAVALAGQEEAERLLGLVNDRLIVERSRGGWPMEDVWLND